MVVFKSLWTKGTILLITVVFSSLRFDYHLGWYLFEEFLLVFLLVVGSFLWILVSFSIPEPTASSYDRQGHKTPWLQFWYKVRMFKILLIFCLAKVIGFLWDSRTDHHKITRCSGFLYHSRANCHNTNL